MFQSALLRGALVALSIIDKMLVKGDALNPNDLISYQIFADAMAPYNLDYDWESMPVTTATGYQIVMFHLKRKVPAAVNKGPVLQLHGMFSAPEEFLTRDDPLLPPIPMQLADDGYDVYIGCTRGREYTLGHDTLDLSI